MAIDSREKRQNMLSFGSPLAWQMHFEADGAVDADDRIHLLHLYGGNVSGGGGPSGALALSPEIVKRRRILKTQ